MIPKRHMAEKETRKKPQESGREKKDDGRLTVDAWWMMVFRLTVHAVRSSTEFHCVL